MPARAIQVAISVFCFCLLGHPAALTAESYTFGVIPQYDQRKIHAVWEPIIALLETRTGVDIELVGAESISVFHQRVLQGAYDFAYMNPYLAALSVRDSGYIPMAFDKARLLRGIVVVRKDRAIQTIKELHNRDVAFPSPVAAGATLLVRLELMQQHDVSVAPVFVKTHSSVYMNVVSGETIAGGGVLRSLEAQPKRIRDSLRVIYKTSGLPAHPIMAHSRVPEKIRNSVTDALLSIGKDGQDYLRGIPIEAIDRMPKERLLKVPARALQEIHGNTNQR